TVFDVANLEQELRGRPGCIAGLAPMVAIHKDPEIARFLAPSIALVPTPICRAARVVTPKSGLNPQQQRGK
ncbi:MAG: hypothetical protein ACRECN_04205, partial [Methylocella sp.]